MSRSPPAEPKLQHWKNYDNHMTRRAVAGSVKDFWR
jgi:hypothetical protein